MSGPFGLPLGPLQRAEDFIVRAAASLGRPPKNAYRLVAKSDGLHVIKWDGTDVGPLAGAGSTALTMIADSLLGADTASFDFTAILGSYKHLRVVVQGRSTLASTADIINIKLNGDTGANYDYYGVAWGSATSMPPGGDAYGQTVGKIGAVPGASSSAGDVGMATIELPDYASTTLNKIAVSTGGAMLARSAGNARLNHYVTSWRSTAAITQVTISPNGGSWKAGSRATLYGVA